MKGRDTPSRRVVRDIELSFVYPPIPDRNFDWDATRKGYEPGDPIGRGRTPLVALADLIEQELELDEEAPSELVKTIIDICTAGYKDAR